MIFGLIQWYCEILKCWLNEEHHRCCSTSISTSSIWARRENRRRHCWWMLCDVCVDDTAQRVANKTEGQRLHFRSCISILKWTFSCRHCVRCCRRCCHISYCSQCLPELAGAPIVCCATATWKQQTLRLSNDVAFAYIVSDVLVSECEIFSSNNFYRSMHP